jgi:hypothetical protein
MPAHTLLRQIAERFTPLIQRTDIPENGRLFLYVEPQAIREICRYLFHDLDAR